MGSNYAPWAVRIEDFWNLTTTDEQLRFLLKFAILAPSTHNSQPWKFRIEDSTISIMPEFTRSLPVSDPHNWHLFISLGCALENLMIAADYYGFYTTVDGLKITFSKSAPSSDKNHLIFTIPQRRCNRSRYDDRMPDRAFWDTITGLNSKNVQISLVADPQKRSCITDLLSESRYRAFSNPAFRKELADYKRTNITRSFTGMPGFTMGFSTLASFFTPTMIRLINVMKFLRKREDMLFRTTPLFCIVSTADNTLPDWIHTGQVVERILLEAQHHHIQSALSAVPPDPHELRNILGITARPQLFIRLGYTNTIPHHSPRLPLEHTLVYG